MACEICGAKDLYTEVTGERACAICKLKFIGGLPTTPERIAGARDKLGLQDGELLKQDCGAEAARILGR